MINKILKPKSEEEILILIKDLVCDSKGNYNNNSLLVRSAEYKFLPGVKRTLEMGADINYLSGIALQWASLNNNYDMVKYLLDSGANVHADNDKALQWALNYGHDDIVELLKKWS